MKRIMLIMAAAFFLTAGGMVTAQDQGPQPGARFRGPGQREAEKTSLTGNLGISRGMISLESGGALYYVMGLDRLIGFIDGLKEGAPVSLEGYAFQSPRFSGVNFFRTLSLGINGKTYDLSLPAEPLSGEPRPLANRPRGWDGKDPPHRNFRPLRDHSGYRDHPDYRDRKPRCHSW
jgi:hypothetical protein